MKNLDDAAWREQRDRLASLGGAPTEAEPRWRLDPILFGPEPTARARAWAERKHWAMAEAAFTEAIDARPLDAAVRLERAGSTRPAPSPRRPRTITPGRTPSAAATQADRHDRGQRTPLPARRRGAGRLGRVPLGEARRASVVAIALGRSGRRLRAGAGAFAARVAIGGAAQQQALALARWDRAYARLMELRPDDGQLWCVRGRYHALRGRWDSGRRRLRPGHHVGPARQRGVVRARLPAVDRRGQGGLSDIRSGDAAARGPYQQSLRGVRPGSQLYPGRRAGR